MHFKLSASQSQFAKYATIGLVSNLTFYGAYILLTRLFLTPQLAMTILYVVGVTVTFLFNRTWTFSNRGSKRAALVRYATAYALAYIINLLLLTLMIDYLDYPHELVQAGLIILIAIALFLAQKYWIFSEREGE